MATLQEGHMLGAYRIVRLLGEGGFGAVYEARQAPLDRQVAVKTLHRELSQNLDVMARFFNEAKVLSRLVHPSIVQVSDFGHVEDGTAYMVMEYLQGQSLRSRLEDLFARGERMATATVLQLGFQLADVLAVAHAQGVIHRDLTPDNLMLVSDALVADGERVKVLDFGIAKLVDAGERPNGLRTAMQAVMGSPSYMSPEQCKGAGHVDARTDVYALGCLLYAMLAGRPPFVGEGPWEILGQQQFQAPQPLPDLAPKVPSVVAELVHRLLTKDKTQRPWMNEVANELATLLAKQTGGGRLGRSQVAGRENGEMPTAGGETIQVSTLGQSLGEKSSRSRSLGWMKWTAAPLLGAVGLLGGVLWRVREVASIKPAQLAAISPPNLPPPEPPAPIAWSAPGVPDMLPPAPVEEPSAAPPPGPSPPKKPSPKKPSSKKPSPKIEFPFEGTIIDFPFEK